MLLNICSIGGNVCIEVVPKFSYNTIMNYKRNQIGIENDNNTGTVLTKARNIIYDCPEQIPGKDYGDCDQCWQPTD